MEDQTHILEIDEQEAPKVYEAVEEAPPTASPDRAAMQAEFYQYVLTRPVEEMEQDILNGFGEQLHHDANAVTTASGEMKVSEYIGQAALNGEDPQAVLDQVRSMRFGDLAAPAFSALLEDSPLGARERRQLDRIVAANEIIEQFQEKEKGGILATAGEFVDIALSDGLQSLIGGPLGWVGIGEDTFNNGARRRELAKEANDLLMSDLPEFEFRAEFSALIGRIHDAGLFTDENSFYLEEFVTMIEEAGEGKTSQAASIFQALDIATAGLGGILHRGASRASSRAATLSKVKGRPAGVATAVKELDKGKPSAVVAEIQPKLTHAANPNGKFDLASPAHQALREMEAEHAAINELMKNGPSYVDPRALEAAQASLKQVVRDRIKNVARHEVDISVGTVGFRNLVGRVTLGKVDGTMYATAASAKALANKIGGEVIEVVEGGQKRFGVAWETNLSTEGLAFATDLKQISKGITTKWSSTARATSRYNQGVKIAGEAANARVIRNASREWAKAASKVSKDEVNLVDTIYTKVLNDPEYAVDGPITDDMFRRLWHNDYEELPRDEVVDYFRTVQNFADANYWLDADKFLAEAVENGETMIRGADGNFYRAKRIEVPARTKIWDDNKQTFVFTQKNTMGYQIKDAAYNVNERGAISSMIVKNPVERRLYHSDVLNYKAGAHRVYREEGKYFAKQETQLKFADGTMGEGAPRTFQSFRTEADANLAVSEFNTIAKNLDEANIDEIIRKNNTWNRNIESKSDFLEFAQKHGLDPSKPVIRVADGDPVFRTRAEAWAGQNTIGSRFAGTYADTAKGRGQQPLIGMGGQQLELMAPARALQMRFARTLNQKADAAYVNRAAQGLFRTIEKLEKKGQKHVKNWPDLNPLSAAQKLRQMEFEDSVIGRQLATERDTIMRALEVKTQDQITTERILGRAADFVYGKKLPWMQGRGQNTVDWLAKADYPGYLRTIAFHSKLGLLSPDQLIVQSSQIINASFIASAKIGPTEVVRTLAGAPWVLRAMATNNPDVIARMAKAQAKVTGISPEDFIEIRQWLHDTGRLVVDRTAVEENRDAVIGAGVKATVANVSTKMFSLGEMNARLFSALLNLKEMRARGFKGSFLGNEAITNKMLSRQDVLTASMTASSAASWQKGLLSIPLQFMTYNRNIMEQVFTSDILTKSERMWLGFGHLAIYGGAAIPGAGFVMDRYGAEILPPETRVYHAARYGALDQGLSMVTQALGGKETALSSRLGVGDGLFTLAQDLGGEASFMEMLYGPGGGITYDVLSGFFGMMESIRKREPLDIQKYEINKFLRIASSWDDASKLYAATVYGEYWTRRSGLTTLEGLNAVDGMVQFFGIPLADEKKLWAQIKNGQAKSKLEQEVYKSIEELSRIGARQAESGDIKGQLETFDHIMFLLAPHPPHVQKEALKRMSRNDSLVDSVIKNLIRDGELAIAERMREDMK